MFVLILPLLFTAGACAVVSTPNGQLNGTTSIDMNGKLYHSFYSIPYAQPPIGALRYKDPRPSSNWTGVRDATKTPPVCFQKSMIGNFTGQDDCLYLNVHTPNLNPLFLKPVIVYIHGGGFLEGTGNDWGPERLVAEDIVFVAMNYRLGIMGFLHFDDPDLEVPGNAGLKDQVLALRWVQSNIKYFGGNPKRVTIAGESAGSCSVHLHVLSPMSQGLFHNAIALSGSALGAFLTGTKNSGPLMARDLGFLGNDPKEQLKFMQNANRSQLEFTMRNVTMLMTVHKVNIFGPIIESNHTNEVFLPDSPRNLLKAGKFNKVPMIMGITDREGILFDLFSYLTTNGTEVRPIEVAIPYFLLQKANASQLESIKNDIAQFYFANNDTLTDQVIRLTGDTYFVNALHESLLGHVQLKQPVYFYRFESDTKANLYKNFHPVTAKYKGACHADDLGYLFKTVYSPVIKKRSIEDKSIRLIVKLYTNFAKYGNPTPLWAKPSDWVLGQKAWKRMDLSNWNNVNIRNDTLTISNKKLMCTYQFWCGLYKKYESPEHHFCFDDHESTNC